MNERLTIIIWTQVGDIWKLRVASNCTLHDDETETTGKMVDF